MTRALFAANLFVFVSSGAFAQTATPPKFEVASIKLSAATFGSWLRYLPGGRFSGMSWLKQVIQVAYGIEDYQVSGGPGWLTTDRYEIEAKAEHADASKKDINMMLQSLLTERFQVKLRHETKEFPVYALVVDKRPQTETVEGG